MRVKYGSVLTRKQNGNYVNFIIRKVQHVVNIFLSTSRKSSSTATSAGASQIQSKRLRHQRSLGHMQIRLNTAHHNCA